MMSPRTLLPILMLLSALPVSQVLAQDTPPTTAPAVAVSFESVEACTAFSSALDKVSEDSKQLDSVLVEKAADREILLASIFEGTQIMLAYGEAMFKASDSFEDKCKSALRDGSKSEEIIQIYNRVFEPTMRAYDFLARVKGSASELGDTQTVTDMDGALSEYKASALKLIDFCEDDLPEDKAPTLCGELRKKMDERLR
ncbi:MAG: hypothetical protein AUK47_08175 [Deltaproteobacteria bacterium CG2_30_63_29]|nr:MAG: hypothetical protein AUK47_08175 [Deltaproteobacteria bacterium CG2_30_63_29]PIV99751.1 MAG: hypothetical protein COW42_10025 [Deltaproteobacteria bacterium CG17_big_fil_post_rev_8_21_14_2_50_63_7]PJB46251.1 MAG: hypothetical protein CO108_06020 [Deltaproteobacteria bacterium CG_4_9_14_3_um_filter_63_12]